MGNRIKRYEWAWVGERSEFFDELLKSLKGCICAKTVVFFVQATIV
jgi:hypothetical protein